MSERGLVIIPPFSFDGQTLTADSITDLHPLLQMALLYWDRIDIPTNNILHQDPSADVQQLMDSGLVQRTRVEFRGMRGSIGAAVVQAQLAAFQKLDKADPGVWSMAQEAAQFYIPDEYATEARTLQVDLYNLLPVPAEETSFEDIVKFRERRRSELIQLRETLDGFYQAVINSADIAHAKTVATDKIDQAISDLWKPMTESFAIRHLPSVKVDFNISSLVTGVAGGVFVAEQFNLDTTISGVTGGVLSSIKIQTGLGRVPNTQTTRADFAYAHAVLKEL